MAYKVYGPFGASFEVYSGYSIGSLRAVSMSGIMLYQKGRPGAVWNKTKLKEVKFNVDNVAAGKPGPAGIERVLRDHLGLVLIRFSKFIGYEESNLAEVLAICEAFKLFVSSSWLNCKILIIENDSLNAVKWDGYHNNGPWKVRHIINNIENLKKNLEEWKVIHVLKEGSQVADGLAKDMMNEVESLFVVNKGV
ncbi:hypothetical protein PTKIN_Ptkin07bG0096300 [Pterospermum kingtungense]